MRGRAAIAGASLLWVAGCACSTSSLPSNSAPTGLTKSADGRAWTFHASSVEELGLPVQKAWSEALADPSVSEFRLALASGRYDAFALTLEEATLERDLTLVVEGQGGVATLSGPLKLEAARVELRDVVLTGVRSEGPTLQVRASERFSAERASLVGNTRSSRDSDDPLVALRAGGRSERGVAMSWRQSWFVGNVVEGGDALIATPHQGRAHVAALELDQVVFTGNRAGVLLEPWFTRSLVCRRVAVAEKELGEAVVGLNSPLVRVEVEGSEVSASALVGLRTSVDVGLDDFQKVEVRGTKVVTDEPLPSAVVVSGPAAGQPKPIDVEASRAAALAGQVPTVIP